MKITPKMAKILNIENLIWLFMKGFERGNKLYPKQRSSTGRFLPNDHLSIKIRDLLRKNYADVEDKQLSEVGNFCQKAYREGMKAAYLNILKFCQV